MAVRYQGGRAVPVSDNYDPDLRKLVGRLIGAKTITGELDPLMGRVSINASRSGNAAYKMAAMASRSDLDEAYRRIAQTLERMRQFDTEG